MREIDALYENDVIPYHTVAHACDTLASMECLMRMEDLHSQLTLLDHSMALIAAAVHDVAHPGNNNLFEVKTMSKLALRYNDVSVLENMHAATAFETLAKSGCNWHQMLTKKDQNGFFFLGG